MTTFIKSKEDLKHLTQHPIPQPLILLLLPPYQKALSRTASMLLLSAIDILIALLHCYVGYIYIIMILVNIII